MALPEPGDRSTALVTGASSGIGEAIARELAGRGYGVTLVARREERLAKLAEELAGEHGVRAEVIAADLADAPVRTQLERRIDGLGLEVEVLVNNAGYGDYGRFHERDRERQVGMVLLNVEALVDLTGRYLPPMVKRGRGAVINIASTAAFQPIPGASIYAATKSFVLSFGDSVHAELAGTGVTLTSVCPGPVRTEFVEVSGLQKAEEQLPGTFWLTAEQVADAAIEGAAKGKRVVVPGLINQAGALFGQYSPRALALPITKRLWRQAL